MFFFFQAEAGIRDYKVTGVQTCALPISPPVALQASSSASWSGFTSGISSGTASSMRCGDELVTTRYPARANRVSTDPATSDGRLENTTSQLSGGSGAWTTRSRTASGTAPGSRQAQAAAYGLPR